MPWTTTTATRSAWLTEASELLRHGLPQPGQGRPVDMIRPDHHRDPLVGRRDPVVLIPVRAAPPGGGAEDMTASQAQLLGVGVAGVDELGPALEHEEARPPVDVRDQHRAARIPQEVLELRARLRDGYADTTLPRVHGDDAELRHPVLSERGEHALRVVVEELLDLRWQLARRGHGCELLKLGDEGAVGSTARPAFYRDEPRNPPHGAPRSAALRARACEGYAVS